jgi:threonine aldolase
MPPPINLYSDTQTRPTAAMRAAIAEAEVGDEQLFADPTVNALCERVAALLGMEAAVFLPTGTMCNAIAMQLHVGRGGDAVHLHRMSHPLRFEAGGPAALSGAVLEPLDGAGGMFSAETLRASLPAPGDRYAPRARLVCVEQTTNVSGGRVWPLAEVRAVLDVAREAGMRAHLDGARLMNAVIASGVPATEWCRGFDTAWIDFTKGLGAPVGAVLAGSRATIDEAWRYKQMMGGAMRQAGIVAAGCLWALDHHVERLAEDHEHARLLADGLAGLPGVTLEPAAVETNIVIFDVPDAAAFLSALRSRDVAMSQFGPRTVRAVTHLDVSRQDVLDAVDAAREALTATP